MEWNATTSTIVLLIIVVIGIFLAYLASRK